MSYEELEKRLVDPIRPKGFPIGIKLLRHEDEITEYVVTRPREKIALCQLLGQARLRGKTVGATAEDIDACVFGTRILGMKEMPEDIADGSRWSELADLDPEVMRNLLEESHMFKLGEYSGIVTAPLRMFDALEADPDLIMVFGNPAQIWALTVAYHDVTGKRLKVDFCGHAACEAIVATAETGEPWVTIPCGGARGLSAVESDELLMTFSVDQLKKMLERVEKARIRYPAGGVYGVLTTSPVEEEYVTKMISRKPKDS